MDAFDKGLDRRRCCSPAPASSPPPPSWALKRGRRPSPRSSEGQGDDRHPGRQPAWGFVTTAGVQDGFAPTSAALRQADRRRAEFVPLAVANRIPALVTGRVESSSRRWPCCRSVRRRCSTRSPMSPTRSSSSPPRPRSEKNDADMGKLTIGVRARPSRTRRSRTARPRARTIRRFDDDAATIQATALGRCRRSAPNAFYVQRSNQARPGVFEKKLPSRASTTAPARGSARRRSRRGEQVHRRHQGERRAAEGLSQVDGHRPAGLPGCGRGRAFVVS